MPLSIVNWAVAQTVLGRDRPDADPADVARYSVLAALLPGAAGLILPFVVQDNLPEDPRTTTDGTDTTTGGTDTTGETGTPAEEIDVLKRRVDATGSRLTTLEKRLDERLKSIETTMAEIKAALPSPKSGSGSIVTHS